MKKSIKYNRVVKKMNTGHGKFFIIIKLPSQGNFKILIKLNCNKMKILKIYKDGNSLSKIKSEKYLDIVNMNN